MKCLTVVLALAAAILLPTSSRADAADSAGARVIVRFKPAAPSVRAKALSARMSRPEVEDVAQTRATGLGLRTGRALSARLSLDERTHVMTSRGETSAALARRLALDSEVEFVAVDERRKHFVVPNDPYYATGPAGGPVAGQWYLKAPTTDVLSSINAPAAWDTTTGTSSIVVAVIDTGVRKDHPDLSAQLVGGYDVIGLRSSTGGVSVAGDGDGADGDASDPGDAVSTAEVNTSGGAFYHCTDPNSDGSYSGTSSSWHGTRVSGLIGAAANNGLGMAGVAWGIKILPVRVLGKCGGYDSDIMAGMLWAAGISVPGLPANPNPAKVLNMSLGGSGTCTATGSGTYRDTVNQITAKGATIVVAAGNSEGEAIGLPGNCPGVIAVTGLRHAGSKVGFSSIGPEAAIAAPGGNCVNVDANGNATGPCLYPMFSTTNRGTTTPVAADNSYTNGGASVGTSFSAPLVSGTVALMLSARPSLTSTEVLGLLKSTARPFVTSGATAGIAQCRAPTSTAQDECYCTTSTCGAGMLDAGKAVAAALAANNETITITATPGSGITVGQTVALSVSSVLSTGRTVTGWAWTLVDGGGAVTGFASSTNTASTSLAPTAAGTITVKIALTDDIGVVHSANSSLVVAAVPVVATTTTTSSSGGGGGGGAVSALWLLLLGGAGLALRRRPA